MILADLSKLNIPPDWLEKAKSLTEELKAKTTSDERKTIIEAKRDETWGHPSLLSALKGLIGNKCWYSEAPLESADANVDHFRPKGRVREINEDDKSPCGIWDEGYWWLAFEYRNFRLSSQHSNQRRVDKVGGTDGGKSDYFPVDGVRCTAVTACDMIHEQILALDPCSATDVALLRFTSEGMPIVRKRKNGVPDPWEERRVNMTVWLYHLNRADLVKRRGDHMKEVKREFDDADCDYRNWQAGAKTSKTSFDKRIAKIRGYLKDDAPFAGAAHSMKLLLIADLYGLKITYSTCDPSFVCCFLYLCCFLVFGADKGKSHKRCHDLALEPGSGDRVNAARQFGGYLAERSLDALAGVAHECRHLGGGVLVNFQAVMYHPLTARPVLRHSR